MPIGDVIDKIVNKLKLQLTLLNIEPHPVYFN